MTTSNSLVWLGIPLLFGCGSPTPPGSAYLEPQSEFVRAATEFEVREWLLRPQPEPYGTIRFGREGRWLQSDSYVPTHGTYTVRGNELCLMRDGLDEMSCSAFTVGPDGISDEPLPSGR